MGEYASIMVCSICGNVIEEIPPDKNARFDIWDCSLTCQKCGKLWQSDDGWKEIGNLLVPY